MGNNVLICELEKQMSNNAITSHVYKFRCFVYKNLSLQTTATYRR